MTKEISEEDHPIKNENMTKVQKEMEEENKDLKIKKKETDTNSGSEQVPPLDTEENPKVEDVEKVMLSSKEKKEKEGKESITATAKDYANNITFIVKDTVVKEKEIVKCHPGKVSVEKKATFTEFKGNIPFISLQKLTCTRLKIKD